jgi:hypothetical protein
MSLPIESAPSSIGTGGGAERSDLAVLETPLVEDMRWCADCGGERLFVEVFRCDAGRVGYCAGCEKRTTSREMLQVRWTRTNSEAA